MPSVIKGIPSIMSKSVLAAFAAAALLSGCSTSNALQFRPTMGGDQAALGVEALAYLNELQRAYVVDRSGGCFMPSIPSVQNTEAESFRRL